MIGDVAAAPVRTHALPPEEPAALPLFMFSCQSFHSISVKLFGKTRLPFRSIDRTMVDMLDSACRPVARQGL
jgi:hypothetical protein